MHSSSFCNGGREELVSTASEQKCKDAQQIPANGAEHTSKIPRVGAGGDGSEVKVRAAQPEDLGAQPECPSCL